MEQPSHWFLHISDNEEVVNDLESPDKHVDT